MRDDFRFEKTVTVGGCRCNATFKCGACFDKENATKYAPVELSRANAGLPTAEGGTKYDDGKPQLSLVSRELLEELAKVRAFGAKKYAKNNYKLGFKYSRSIDAALRHIAAFNSGENNDPESGLSHIGHALACLEHLLHDSLYRPENDDR